MPSGVDRIAVDRSKRIFKWKVGVRSGKISEMRHFVKKVGGPVLLLSVPPASTPLMPTTGAMQSTSALSKSLDAPN